MQTTHLTDKVIPLFSTPVFVEVGKDMPDVIPNIKDLEYHNYSNRHKGGEHTGHTTRTNRVVKSIC